MRARSRAAQGWGRVAFTALACALLAMTVADPVALAGGRFVPWARAAESWDAEFEAVCSKTQDAMSLSSDELRSLVARCDKLKPGLGGLEESRRKVYSKRLKMCRDLYQFVLDSRREGEAR